MTTVSNPPSVDGSSPQRAGTDFPGRARIGARTLRTDRWWLPPLLTVLGLLAWLVYAVVRAALQRNYFAVDEGYLTPFASPCLSQSCIPEAAHFGRPLPEFPPLIPFAALSLIFLLGFRLTCYYYRKAYYRSFWLAPPACAVAEPHGRYTGETRFPLIFQNAHRYFFYAAVIISAINTYDAVLALIGPDGFRLGLGNFILWANVILLWAYTVSCHSCRHLMGGRLKHFSRHPLRYRAWTTITALNTRHMELAWITLASLALTDGYIALVSSGVIVDLRIVN